MTMWTGQLGNRKAAIPDMPVKLGRGCPNSGHMAVERPRAAGPCAVDEYLHERRLQNQLASTVEAA